MNATINYATSLSVYTSSNGTCTNTCHGNTAGADWRDANPIPACIDCHQDTPTNYVGPAPSSGLHVQNGTYTDVMGHDDNFGTGPYTCTDCHTGPDPTGTAHINGTTNTPATATFSWNTTSKTINLNTLSSATDDTCSAACHTDNNNWVRLWSTDAYSSATTPGNNRCNVCHGQAGNWRTGMSVNHDRTGINTTSNHTTCEMCHVAPNSPYSWGTNHENNSMEYNSNLNYSTTSGNCNTACHGNDDPGHTMGVSSIFTGTSALSGLTVSCSSCHGYPPTASGTNNKHVAGATPVDHDKSRNDDGVFLMSKHSDCVTCHGTKDDGSGNHAPHANYTVSVDHNTGEINMNTVGAGYNTTNYGCDAACHANTTTYRLSDSGLTVAGGDYGGAGGPCHTCHGNSNGATAGTYTVTSKRNVGSDFDQSSRHVFGGTETDWDCVVCHAEGDQTVTSGSADTNSSTHPNGVVNMRNVDSIASNWTWDGTGTADQHRNMDLFCTGCHDSDGATGIAVVGTGTGIITSGLSAAQRLGPFNDTDGIGTGGQTADAASGPTGWATRPNVVDVKGQFNPGTYTWPQGNGTMPSGYNGTNYNGNDSQHNVLGPRYYANNSNWGSAAWVNVTLKSGQNLQTVREKVQLHCADCHTVDTNAHGSSVPFMLTGSTTGTISNSNIDGTCYQCHPESVYENGASTASRWNHDNYGRPYAAGVETRWNNSVCLTCHGAGNKAATDLGKWGGIHGVTGTDSLTGQPRYRFQGGAYMTPNPGNNGSWTTAATNISCYFQSSTDSLSNCTKHSGNVNKSFGYNYGRATKY